MAQLTDQQYLRREQYRDASNLNARVYVHRHFSTNNHRWYHWVFDHFDPPARCGILEVGCGPGHLWLENEGRITGGWRITLSDLSPCMVQKARYELRSGHRRFRYCVLDAQALPFPDECFDSVIANHVLYHVPHRQRSLGEIHRVLRPGGRLYAATNGLGHLLELEELVTRFCPDADTTNPATEFGLENGAKQLLRHFATVTLHRREDGLAVTEAGPLIAYARSMMCHKALAQNLEALGRAVHEQIASHGVIHIQKDSGMFIATRT